MSDAALEGPFAADHLRDALARDPRVSELGFDIRISEQTVFVGGAVSTAERRDGAIEVVRELMPGYEVVDEMTVQSDWQDAGEPEVLR